MTNLASGTGGFSDVVATATASYGSEMAIVGAAAVLVGVGIWGLRKGWGYFKSLSH